METYLPEKALLSLKEAIQLELLKRGVSAPILTLKETLQGTAHILIMETDCFQTTPVMFKKLWVRVFSSSITKEGEEEAYWYNVRVDLIFSYKHFSGGSNACEFFNFDCKISSDGSIYNIQTS